MTKIEIVRQEMMKALKEKEMERKNALSLLLSALKAKFIDKRADLTEDEENEIIWREIKQTQETLDSSPADRTDLIEECRLRIRVYSEFVPSRMTEDEIRQALGGVLRQLGIENPAAKDRGAIMKSLMPLVKGRADGAVVSRIVGQAIGG